MTDIAHAPADRDWHGVIFRLNVELQLFQLLHDLYACVESLHSLWWTLVRRPSVFMLEVPT